MAVIGTEEDPNNPNGTLAGVNGSGGGSAFAGGGGGQGATVKAPAPTSSGSFTNLQKYMDANQGAAANMGQGIAGTINQAGQKTDKAINDYVSTGAPGAANAESANDNLQGILKNANGGMPGFVSLLNQTYSQPGYTGGERGLDAALINGGGAKDAIKSAADAWSGEGKKLSDTAASVAEMEGRKAGGDQSYQQSAQTDGGAKPYLQMAGAGPTTNTKQGAGVTWLTPGQLQSGFTNAPLPNAIDYGNRQPEFASFTPEQYQAFANGAKATQAANTPPAPQAAPTVTAAPGANSAGVSGVSSGSSSGGSPYGGVLGQLGGSPATGLTPSNVAAGAQQASKTTGQVAKTVLKKPRLR